MVEPTLPIAMPDKNAVAYLRDGNFSGAAAEFARLSLNSSSTESSRYRAMAALTYLDGDDPESAAILLSKMPSVATVASPLLTLALAASDNFDGGTSEAMGHLELIDAKKFSTYQRNVYYRTLGRLSIFNRAYSAAATAFIAADAYALPETKRVSLHKNIWKALSHMDDAAIHAAYGDGSSREKGWLELVISVLPNLRNKVEITAAIESWQAKYPEHAANLWLIPHIYQLSESLSIQIGHIALLLPFDGTYGNASIAIRDGFLSAWYTAPQDGNRPTVSVYYVDAGRVNAVYDTAVANGADLIVGPLKKSAVETLISRDELPIRTLTLNVADNSIDPNVTMGSHGSQLFQFGLLPEDEAANVAEKARADGYLRAVTLSPATAWGRRLTKGFSYRWQQLGGVVLAEATYGDQQNSYVESVKHALKIDQSEARAAVLQQALNQTIQFEPRRRADIDMIFVAGFPLSTRQLLPHLRYFRAETVPVYSTSHTYAGVTDAAADRDLDGLRFGDMPWVFGTADIDTFKSFNHNWPNSAPGSGRLFAFGLDAYRILPHLNRMRHQPGFRISGVTGQLRMTPTGRVVRELVWARFVSGEPKLLRK